MMITFDDLFKKYRMDIHGALHCGAHVAQEARDYARHGIEPVVWIEANADLIPRIKKEIEYLPNQQVIQALVYDQDDVEVGFNITNYDAISSSILEWGTHKEKRPDCDFVERRTLRSTTIDTLVDTYGITADYLSMDLQGGEMYALRGAERFLQGVNYIFTEVNFAELYAGCVRVGELDAWLGGRGFIRAETCMAENHVFWGDSLYLRPEWA